MLMNLNWNPYINWENNVETYNIYRVTESGISELVASSAASDTAYTVSIGEFIRRNSPISGQFCYYVEAIETGTDKYGIKGKSISNIACETRAPIVYLPNAFSPNNDLINDVFMPAITFISKNDYEFKIYDRWGQIIFSTTDYNKGWNGKTGSKPVKGGIYIYYLQYKSVGNELFEKCGYFTVIR